MTNCLFCKIVAKEIPSAKVLENSDFLAFRDIDPKAPVHVLVIPKKHFEDIWFWFYFQEELIGYRVCDYHTWHTEIQLLTAIGDTPSHPIVHRIDPREASTS